MLFTSGNIHDVVGVAVHHVTLDDRDPKVNLIRVIVTSARDGEKVEHTLDLFTGDKALNIALDAKTAARSLSAHFERVLDILEEEEEAADD